MEPIDSSSPPRDTSEKGSKPSPTREPETWVKGLRSLGIDNDLGEGFMNRVLENATSILEFSVQWEEYDKEMELREISVKKQIEKLEERVRLFEERERKTEASFTERLSILQQKEEEFDVKLFLEASVMRLFLHMQSEEVVDSMNCLMMKKHEELMRELQEKKDEIALLSKSIDEKPCDLEMKVKDFDLRQTTETERKRKEAELMEISLKQLETRENELVLFNDTIREKASELEKKEEKCLMKQQAEAREMDLKMKVKHDKLMRELEAKKEEVALLSKSIDEKSCDLAMKVKGFDLKQTAETERRRKEAELMEISRKKLEARENELILLNDTIREKSSEKKEENFQLKQQAEARDLDLKNKFLELKEREIEERSMQAKTCKRPRLESEHSLSEEKDRYAESLNRPRKKHKSITEHNHDDEDKKRDCAIGVPPSTSSHIQISEAREREIEEAVPTDGIDENHMPLMFVDSEFNDFSKTISSFVVGQVWALYDNIDSMPRYYGRIKRVAKSGSSFLVTWLEPKDKAHVLVSCGKFKWGKTETIKRQLAFSHVMNPIIHGRHSITVIPKVGETWALFSDWSKSWNNNPEQHKPPYRFDFVEIVVDFDDCLGIGVAYLGKVEGFVSVYKQAEKHGFISLMIAPEEMLRFSHRVPSFKMNGEEKGVPVGSFELDPAAISSSVPQLVTTI